MTHVTESTKHIKDTTQPLPNVCPKTHTQCDHCANHCQCCCHCQLLGEAQTWWWTAGQRCSFLSSRVCNVSYVQGMSREAWGVCQSKLPQMASVPELGGSGSNSCTRQPWSQSPRYCVFRSLSVCLSLHCF